MPSSGESSPPRGQIRVFMSPALTGWFFTTSGTWEALFYVFKIPNDLLVFLNN